MKHTIPSILVSVLLTGFTLADELFMFVTDDEHPYPAQLVGYGHDGIDIIDPIQGHVTIPDDECVVFLRPTPRIDLSGMTRLQLKDGQVFIGQPTSTDSAESCQWTHPRFGQLSIPLDLIDSMHIHPSTNKDSFTPSLEADEILLRNGDVLSGFIMGLSNPIEIEVERSGTTEVISVPWDRIASIHLFGESSPPKFPRIWFRDGTIASFPTLTFEDDWWLKVEDHPLSSMSSPHTSKPPSIAMVHAIGFNSSPIVALVRLSPSSIEVPETRTTAPGPRAADPTAVLGLSPIECSGPATFHWSVPDGMNRFRSTVRLPSAMQRWGDLRIEFAVDGVQHRSIHLHGDAPSADIDMVVDGRVLTIRLLEGENGPVQDTVVFEYPMFMSSPVSTGG